MENDLKDNRIKRTSVPALDAILEKTFPVLDQGHIRVIDYRGDDAAIVQAARVTYGAGTKQIQEDRGLIRYLLRNSHTTPFEMCELKLHVRVPMDCWRQWIRHRPKISFKSMQDQPPRADLFLGVNGLRARGAAGGS